MEIVGLIRIVRRRWWLLLLPVIIVTILVIPDFLSSGSAVSGGFTTAIRYSAAQEFNLPQRDGDYQDVWLASEFVVNAFTDWIKTSSFQDELRQILSDDIDLNGLNIASDNDRSIGIVEMTYPTAELDQIAQAAITVLQTRNQVYFPHLGDEPAEVNVLDAPRVQPFNPPLTNRLTPLIQLGVAFIVGLGLAVLAEYFDRTLRYPDEIEAQGIPVLAQVPKQ